MDPLRSPVSCLCVQLSKCTLFILIIEKEGQHMVLEHRIYSAQWKYEPPGLEKDVSG